MTTILLVDDHPMVRWGLRAALGAEPGWVVAGDAADGETGLDMVARLRPDILVLDLQMPGLSGLDVLRQVHARSSETRVILFSMHAEDTYVRDSLAAGASAYVLKDADAAELILAIRVALTGGRYLSRALSERAIAAYVSQPGDSGSVDWAEMLTARERQVLILAARGHTNLEIAERLSISPRTAETHRTNLLRKLGLKGQSDLTRFADERGLLEHT